MLALTVLAPRVAGYPLRYFWLYEPSVVLGGAAVGLACLVSALRQVAAISRRSCT
ncbi:hypothetical protein [Aestuariimicrobium ganziense]|uniref:hypothetical protein n=1 Tax=Aestuariimicrobium ganziense TaxID=2773677 RepID=UPI001944DEF4|nr:hypothetical protein [Aestuariimicrobium ganziense]